MNLGRLIIPIIFLVIAAGAVIFRAAAPAAS